jgi:hypothetical protein
VKPEPSVTPAKRSQIMSIIKAYSGQQAVIGIPRVYIGLTGDYVQAALLNQILYWSERTTDPDGWFYKSYTEWQDELCISQYQVKRAIEGDKRRKPSDPDNKKPTCLRDLGVQTTLKKSKAGAPTIHYRVDEATFIKALTEYIDSLDKKPTTPIVNNVDNPIINIVDNPLSTMSTMDCEQSQQSLRAKITTETTPKNTKKKKESAPTAQVAKTNLPIDYPELIKEIGYAFSAYGSEANLVATILMGTSKTKGWIEHNLELPMNHTELKAYRQWYGMVYSDRTKVKKPHKINSSVQEWRVSGEYQLYLKQIVSDSVSSAPPTMAAIDAKLYHAPSQAEIDAMPDLCTPEEAHALLDMTNAAVDALRFKKKVARLPEGKAG